MDFNTLTLQLNVLQDKANALAEICDEESDALFYMDKGEAYDIQKQKCKALSAEWEKLDEAVELTRNLISALCAYNDFAEKNTKLGLI